MRWLYTLLFLLISCQSSPPEPARLEGVAMTMQFRILLGDATRPEALQRARQIAELTFAEVNAIYNKWNPQSELSRLNRYPPNDPFPLSPELYNFLLLTNRIVELTEGRFDPTVESAMDAWKEKLSQGETLQENDSYPIGWSQIKIENGTATKLTPGLKLDLGGIAKGYCVDLLIERLAAAGFSNTYVEWGGEIRTAGEHPQKRPWSVFISNFGSTDNAQSLGQLDLTNCAIATSGDYYQNWTVKPATTGTEKTFCHIMNPKTKMPLEIRKGSIGSVSVVAPTCTLADGLATSIMLFPSIEEAENWADQFIAAYPDVQFRITTRD